MQDTREVALTILAQLLLGILEAELDKLPQGAVKNLAELMTDHGGQLRWVVGGRPTTLACQLVMPEPETKPATLFVIASEGVTEKRCTVN